MPWNSKLFYRIKALKCPALKVYGKMCCSLRAFQLWHNIIQVSSVCVSMDYMNSYDKLTNFGNLLPKNVVIDN